MKEQEKEALRIDLNAKETKEFRNLKKELRFRNNTDVIRFALKFTSKNLNLLDEIKKNRENIQRLVDLIQLFEYIPDVYKKGFNKQIRELEGDLINPKTPTKIS